MKHLFVVAVALGIFSGTSTIATAQNAVNAVKFSNANAAKKSTQFNEGIEIKRDATPVADIDMWAVPAKKPVIAPATPAPVKTVAVTKAGNAAAIEASSTLQFKYAQLLDMEVEAVTNVKLFTVIEDWWATRYRYGGTTKKGIDCSAFTGTLMNEVYGLTLQRTARDQYAQCDKINREDLVEGDLVFFNTRGGVSHVGVYLGNGYFVHSSVHSGVTINSLDEDYYSRKYIGGGRLNLNQQ
jgi:murein DD-endopeptidase / murein LD-carboxypeptidase